MRKAKAKPPIEAPETVTVIPGVTHCYCANPRYERIGNGEWRSRIFQDGRWRLIRDGAKKCAGCGMDLRTAPKMEGAGE